MGTAYMFNIKCSDNDMPVYRSHHANKSRTDDKYVRDFFIDNKRYKEIVEMAIKHGLTSFRNKGPVAVSFSDNWRSNYSVLMAIDNYRISIITVYDSKIINKQNFFLKIHNRINLWNYYTMKCMTKEEKIQKRLESIKIDISIRLEKEKQDKMFNIYTSSNGIKRKSK